MQTTQIHKEILACAEKLTKNTPSTLAEAILYCLKQPGKYFRSQLVFASSKICNATNQQALSIAIAIELLHTYSLVHDDLPCMDDDDFRRNQPSCHKAYTPATAVLVGDCLQSMALQYLASCQHINTKVIASLCESIGPNGMAGGQFLDLYEPNNPKLFELKTGALFAASLLLPAYCSDSNKDIVEKLKLCAFNIGIGYQIQDDKFDNESSHSSNQYFNTALMAIKDLANNHDLINCINLIESRTF